jgi:hypothetical protein
MTLYIYAWPLERKSEFNRVRECREIELYGIIFDFVYLLLLLIIHLLCRYVPVFTYVRNFTIEFRRLCVFSQLLFFTSKIIANGKVMKITLTTAA